MPPACRVQWSWVDRTGDTVSQQSQRRMTSPTVIEADDEACLLTTRSKTFRQHLKTSLTAPRRAGTSSRFFGFFLLSQLSEPGRLGDLLTALSGPASRLATVPTTNVACQARCAPCLNAAPLRSTHDQCMRQANGMACDCLLPASLK